MKSNSISKIFLTIIVSLIATISVSVLASCSQQKIKLSDPYPNTICENAKISDEYNEFAQLLSNATLWEMYDISKIPRQSGNMDQIRNYILNWSKTYDVKPILDSSGCIYIDLAPSKGHEKDKSIIIQAHMDMVVNYNEDYTEFNPDTSPIDLYLDEKNGEVHSKDFKTNVGADNSQGLGLCLAIAKYSHDFDHGPIRILFTYDEETTMEGSNKVSEELLNAEYLINFDCPKCGVAAVGAAGDIPISIEKKYNTFSPSDKGESKNINFQVNDLKGGHSGIDINAGRLSASALMIQFLNELTNKSINFRLVSINCGDMTNGIPDSFNLTLNLNKKYEEDAVKIFNELIKSKKSEFKNENEFNFSSSVAETDGNFPSQQDTQNILDILNCIPNGVLKMNDNLTDEVEDSCNVGIIQLKNGYFKCESLLRSSNNKSLENYSKQIPETLKNYNIDCSITSKDITQAWYPEETSLTNLYLKAMKETCGIDASLVAPHAGMEASVFKIKKPSIKIISIGGDVKDEHMLTETFYLKSFPVAVTPVIYIIDHVNELD